MYPQVFNSDSILYKDLGFMQSVTLGSHDVAGKFWVCLLCLLFLIRQYARATNFYLKMIDVCK